jgi:hypothetical protein
MEFNYFIFISDLCNNASSSSDCVMLYDRMTVINEWERMWKEAIMM